jgi:peptidoglycan lytic transglycosylase G
MAKVLAKYRKIMMERPWFLKTWAEPSRPSGGAARAVLSILACLLAVFLVLQSFWIFTAAPAVQAGPRVVEIPAHLGLSTVARRLDEAGVIRSPLGFMLLAVARGTARALKAGEYEVPQGANTFAVLGLLEGGRVRQHALLFREGDTLAELALVLERERLSRADDILRVARDPVFLKTLDIAAENLEGYLFPDTYQLVKGMTPEEILARMASRMRDHITPEMLERARAREITVHQLLTLASIIEKEAVVRGEMPLISAVFWNRLKRGMPLQADPTVQFAVGKNGRALSRADLQVESPYNTYRRGGLPPGPIAAPGRAALEAAVRPAAVNYLYFVSIDDRRHHFSTSLAEHNSAVAQYRMTKLR